MTVSETLSLIVDVFYFGVYNGGIIALVALGVAMIYKATGVLNFAQGSIGSSGVFAGYLVLTGGTIGGSISDPGAGDFALMTAAVLAVAVVLALGTNAIIQRLADASAVTSLVATAGIALLLVSLQVVIFEAQARDWQRYVSGAAPFDLEPIGGTAVITWHFFVTLLVIAVCAVLLTILFRTPAGVALLATSQERFAARLQGISVASMTTLAWAVAGVLAGLAAILAAGQFNQVTPGFMLSTWLLPGFVAALLGGITSMVGALVGGLVIGVVFSFAETINQQLGLGIPGAPHFALLAVLLAVLVARPQGLLGQEA
jgi:branched-chain amino acid transport system permease protein